MKDVDVILLERYADGGYRAVSADCDAPAGTDALGWALGAGGAAATPQGFVATMVEWTRLGVGERPRAVVVVERAPDRSPAPASTPAPDRRPS